MQPKILNKKKITEYATLNQILSKSSNFFFIRGITKSRIPSSKFNTDNLCLRLTQFSKIFFPRTTLLHIEILLHACKHSVNMLIANYSNPVLILCHKGCSNFTEEIYIYKDGKIPFFTRTITH